MKSFISWSRFLPTFFWLIILIWRTNADSKVQTQELTSGWTLRNENQTIIIRGIRLPSGVYSELSNDYGDVLQSENDDKLRWIANDNWTYAAQFDVIDLKSTQRINLTLHGIDTVSEIRLNGNIIGRTENMFARYSFDISDAVSEKNILEIAIQSPIWASQQRATNFAEQYPPNCPPEHVNGVCHRNMLRKMQASFGSDATLAALSMGIWKSVTLEFYAIAIMRDVDIAVRKIQNHWSMDIRVFISSSAKKDFYGNMTFMAPDLLDEPIVFPTRTINYASLVLDYNVQIPEEKVVEWWPNGYGEQKLYPLVFKMKCFEDVYSKFQTGWVTRKIVSFGFRTLELVEDEDENGRTFYFKVNGRPIFMKGAIYLPSHILPEEESHLSASGQERIKHLLISAKEANLNMIRIWGGGVYGSDYLYHLADMFGILIWQDMPFTGATYPMDSSFIESVRREVAQNARRIAYHSSLAIIVTNNEIELFLIKNHFEYENESYRLEREYRQLFKGIIEYELNIISRNEYNPRPGPLLTTPSLGCEEHIILAINPQDLNFGDVHFWPADGEDALNVNTWKPARFISEYGFQSLPVHVSWNRSLGVGDTILGIMQHRQHEIKRFKALTDVVAKHFPNLDWKADIETFIYFSQVAQAMAVKTATEVYLSNYNENYRTMGAIYWHLNDVWIAPTWSSIDYFGNYKLLYYWSKDFLSPITIIALKDEQQNAIKVTIINDGEAIAVNSEEEETDAGTFDVSMNIYFWSELFPQKTIVRQENLEKKIFKQFLVPLNEILVDPFTENNCFIEFILSKGETIYAQNIFFPSKLNEAVGIKDPQLKMTEPHRASLESTTNNNYILRYGFVIQVSTPAVFVYIEVFHPEIKKYKLSENGFILMDPIRTLYLSFEHGLKELEMKLTKEHIKITTINQFMVDVDDVGG